MLSAAEVIVNYLASHVLLVYNESRQKEIIRVYDEITRDLPQEQRRAYSFDSTIPDDQCKQAVFSYVSHIIIVMIRAELNVRDSNLLTYETFKGQTCSHVLFPL